MQDQNIIFLLGQGGITPLTNPTFMDELESKLKNKMQKKQAFVCATLNLVLAHFLSNTCGNLLSVFRVWLDHTFSATTFSLLHLHLSPASGAGCAKFGTMRPSRKTLPHMQPGAFHSSSFLYHSPPSLICSGRLVLKLFFFPFLNMPCTWQMNKKPAEFE